MKSVILVAAMAGCLALLAGCATDPVSEIKKSLAGLFQGSKAEQALAAGVKQFEDGDYADATKSLQSSLDLGLPRAADGMKAHKYLAFIHCVSGRQRPCQDEFAKALEIDPSMELETSEAGHPIWGPVFRSAKARK
jgi:Tfp pilus assembly protein PilF